MWIIFRILMEFSPSPSHSSVSPDRVGRNKPVLNKPIPHSAPVEERAPRRPVFVSLGGTTSIFPAPLHPYYYLPTSSFLCTFLRGYVDKQETGQDRACPSSPPFRGFPVFLCFLFSCLAVPLGSDSFGCDSAALCPSVVGFLPLSRHAHFQSGTAWPPCFRSSSHRWRPGASARRRFSRIFPLAAPRPYTYRDTGPGRHAEGISRHLRWMGEFSSFSSGPPRDHRSPPAAPHRKEMDP